MAPRPSYISLYKLTLQLLACTSISKMDLSPLVIVVAVVVVVVYKFQEHH